MSIRYITENGKYAMVYDGYNWQLYEVALGVDTRQWWHVCELIEGSFHFVRQHTEEMVKGWDDDNAHPRYRF